MARVRRMDRPRVIALTMFIMYTDSSSECTE
jgi:hypothetical protein